MRRSMVSFPVLLSVVLLLACDSPSQDVVQPKGAPAEVGTRTAEPAAKAPVGAPLGAAEPAQPPTDGVPAKAEPAPVDRTDAAPAKTEPAPPAGDAAAAVDPPPKAKATQPSAPEASTVRKAKAFTDCRSSEAFADGRCYPSREAACEALSCAGKCVHTRSMPPQVVCG